MSNPSSTLHVSELQLQAKCFQWAWNTFPATRRLLWHVTNEMKPIRVVTCRREGHEMAAEESSTDFRRRIAQAKAAGLVPGVADLHFFWKGCLFCFELKVGKNIQSKEQIEWEQAMRAQGGVVQVIRSFDEFKEAFLHILNTIQ